MDMELCYYLMGGLVLLAIYPGILIVTHFLGITSDIERLRSYVIQQEQEIRALKEELQKRGLL